MFFFTHLSLLELLCGVLFENLCSQQIITKKSRSFKLTNIAMAPLAQEKNEEVRKRTGQIRLEEVIRERRMRWLGHVTRMDEVRIPKEALHWEVAGFRRRPGRPRMNWGDVVKKDLQRMGLTWEEVETSAQGRHSWRQRVALCIGNAE